MSLLDYLLVHHKLRVKRGDLVVEVGPGADRFLRSDIIVEKYIEYDTEHHLGLVLDRPSLSADGSLLPFHDKSVDYIICPHVLERVPDAKCFLDG